MPSIGMHAQPPSPRMGLTTSKKPSSACIRGNERLLSDVLDTSYRPFRFVGLLLSSHRIRLRVASSDLDLEDFGSCQGYVSVLG